MSLLPFHTQLLSIRSNMAEASIQMHHLMSSQTDTRVPTDLTGKELRTKQKAGWLHRIRRQFTTTMLENLKPEKPVGDAPGFWQGLKAIIFASCTCLVDAVSEDPPS